MIYISDDNVPGQFWILLLEMAFQAKGLVARIEQALIDRAVRRMADNAALAQRFVFVNKRTALRGVALKASLVLAQESHAALFERLLDIRSAAFDRHADVRVMAIGATDSTLQHRVMMGKLKLGAHFQVTLKTSLR